MRSISIINTSIQLINVIEAIQKTGCKENYLIIGQFNISPDRIKKIEKMLEDKALNKHFKKIYSLPTQFSSKNPLRFLGYILAFIKFLRIISFSRRFDYCFFGVYTDILQLPVAFLSYYRNRKINLWLIDEGIRVVKDVKLRKGQLELLKEQDKRKKFLPRDFYYGFTKKWIPPHLIYFSIYDLNISERDSLERNEYIFLKANNEYKYNFDDNAVILIGQPYVELKMISAETYKNLVNRILTVYSDSNCYYVPHPMEELYESFLPKHIKIIKTQFPVELLLLGAEFNSLIGFQSSVLYNAAKMGICDDIQSYVIDSKNYIIDKDIMAADEMQRMFINAGIKLVY